MLSTNSVTFDGLVAAIVARIGPHGAVDVDHDGIVSTSWGDAYDGDGASVYITKSDDGVTIHARRRGTVYAMAWVVSAAGIAESVLGGADTNSVTTETAVEIAALAMWRH